MSYFARPQPLTPSAVSTVSASVTQNGQRSRVELLGSSFRQLLLTWANQACPTLIQHMVSIAQQELSWTKVTFG